MEETLEELARFNVDFKGLGVERTTHVFRLDFWSDRYFDHNFLKGLRPISQWWTVSARPIYRETRLTRSHNRGQKQGVP